jgi:V8-like Glu-specific endopeptidase
MSTYVPKRASEYPSIACLFSLIYFALGPSADAQPAPAPFRIVTELTAEGVTLSALTARSAQEPRDIRVPEAKWLQIVFGEFNLGESGQLKIEGVNSREVQNFNQETLEAWGGTTARFRATHLRLSVEFDPVDEADEIFYVIEQILVGEPAEARFPEIPEMFLGFEEGSAPEERPCDNVDDRDKSEDKRVGRIMPIGCTAWIAGDDIILSAGHCVNEQKMKTLEFNVPFSDVDRSTTPSAIEDQYAVIWDSVVSHNNSSAPVGDDWAVFRVAENTETELLPKAAQGGQFTLSNTVDPGLERVTVAGYGVDDGIKNQTLQMDKGDFKNLIQVEDEGVPIITYTADVAGGTSGAPVVAEAGTGEAIGIHNSHCIALPNLSIGTSFQNAELWQTIQEFNNR